MYPKIAEAGAEDGSGKGVGVINLAQGQFPRRDDVFYREVMG